MSTKKETPQQQRERMYEKEQRKNPAGTYNDHLNRTQASMPNTTGMSVKEIGVLIVIALVLFVGYSIFKTFQ